MSAHRRRTDMIADPSFAADASDLDLDTLRRRRQTCLDVERELSYQRRLLHGRLDLIDFELRRRRGEVSGDPVSSLPGILADDHAVAARGAATAMVIDPSTEHPARRRIDTVLADTATGRLEDLTEDELDAARDRAAEMEREVSSQRRAVYAAEEALATELARRYRDGAATPDELITG